MKNKLPATCLIACVLLSGCGDSPSSSAPAAASAPSVLSAPAPSPVESVPTPANTKVESLALVRQMMELDAETLSVAAYGEAAQKICTDAGAEFFAVVADATELYESPEMDVETYTFMQTTLEYTGQYLFGELAFWSNAMYLTTGDKTAAEMATTYAELEPAQWQARMDELITGDQIKEYIYYNYLVEYELPDSDAITAAQRDAALNGLVQGMQDHVSALTPEQLKAAADPLDTELESLAAQNSSDLITIRFTETYLEDTSAM